MNSTITLYSPTLSDELNRLKNQFRDICGMLSIQEIMSNEQLIRAIRNLDKMLNQATLEDSEATA